MLHLIVWTAVGLLVGALARLVTRRVEFGTAGDLVAGWLGALVSGWIVRTVAEGAPQTALGHAVVAMLGAVALLACLHALARTHAAARRVAVDDTTLSGDATSLLQRLGALEQRLVHAFVARRPSARDPNAVYDASVSFGERIADRVAQFGGSWTFIGLFVCVLVAWMAWNEGAARPFDPFPFILLNLVLSCVAALQAPVIMMSQNRQSAKDRSDARADYEVNVRAELEVMALHAKLDLLREQDWARLTATLERQAQAIEALEARLAAFEHRDR